MTAFKLSNNTFIKIVKDGVLYADNEEIPEGMLKITTKILMDWETLDDCLIDRLDAAIQKYKKERDY